MTETNLNRRIQSGVTQADNFYVLAAAELTKVSSTTLQE